jgi:hypothetical protein
MTSPRAPILAGLAAALLAVPPAAHAAGPADLLYERTLMDQAGSRCRLFSPEIASALSAAEAQARGAALRAGVAGRDVAATQARAGLKAYAVPCGDPGLAVAAARVRKAFDGYARLRDMSFPGSFSAWQADRKPWPLVVAGKVQAGPRWRLSQSSTSDGAALVFGMASGPQLVAVTTARGAASAAGARLVMRDPAKAADAFIDPRRGDLGGRVPPRWQSQVFLAQSIGPAPAGLLPPGAQGGVMVVFPASAAAAMATLDPREAVTVELAFPTRNGERVQSALVEVGDFAAGRAFLAAGR